MNICSNRRFALTCFFLIVTTAVCRTQSPVVRSTFISRFGALRASELSLSPDDRYLAAGRGIWELGSRHYLGTVARDYTASVWGPDSKSLLIGSSDGLTRLYDIPSLHVRRTFRLNSTDSPYESDTQGSSGEVSALAWSPNGRFIVTAYHQEQPPVIWDTRTGKRVRELDDERMDITSMCWLPNDIILCFGFDSVVATFNSHSGKRIREFRSATHHYQIATELRNGVCASYEFDSTQIDIWNVSNKTLCQTQIATRLGIRAISIASDGASMMVATTDGSITRRAIPSGAVIREYPAYRNTVALQCSNHGTFVVSGSNFDNTIRVWDTTSGMSHGLWTGLPIFVTDMAWNPAGDRLGALASSQAYIIDILEGRFDTVLVEHSNLSQYSGIAWCPDGKQLALLADSLSLHQLPDYAVTTEARFDSLNLRHIAFSPDGSYISAESDDTSIIILRASELRTDGHLAFKAPVREFGDTIHRWYTYFHQWSPDGKYIGAFVDAPSRSGERAMVVEHRLAIWEATTRSFAMMIDSISGTSPAMTWAPDGRRVAVTAYRDIQIWDVAEHRKVTEIVNPGGWEFESFIAPQLDWNPKRSLIASTADSGIYIWNVETGTRALRLALPKGAKCWSLRWDPTGRYLASATDDDEILIWKIE